jgi:hypothetical protein
VKVDTTTTATTTTRAQLKKIVRQYLDAMRSLGRDPNRTVAFENVPRAAWLIDDPAPHAKRRRYLLLDDGDTWCETVYGPQPASSGLVNTYRWLPEPTPALAYTLGQSLDDARDGGSGFLIPAVETGVLYSVSDRRAMPRK